MGTMLEDFFFQIPPQEKVTNAQIGRSCWPPQITPQRDESSREHLPQFRHRNAGCMRCCSILLKPNLPQICLFTQLLQFRLKKVFQHENITLSCNCNSMAIFLKKISSGSSNCMSSYCGSGFFQ
ncbi:PREDICTED: uncharacterized protein LOC106746865 [Dinoponera quadriceps]|uniref:Uncharacterized protein LOC106746865 n=1 Tax=Dinoponera quadriceps TaxID=609295 RepID=A0A6P3XNF5_DINQU|nr:PREDICTED: uncharacterized protein LOC106746865 [Dinoponera quadriceps]